MKNILFIKLLYCFIPKIACQPFRDKKTCYSNHIVIKALNQNIEPYFRVTHYTKQDFNCFYQNFITIYIYLFIKFISLIRQTCH